MGLLIGGIALVIYFTSTEATFTFTSNTLSREITGKSSLFRNAKKREFYWNEIANYKNGTDRGKYRGEYQYLEIKFRNGDKWEFTDMYGELKAGFNEALQFFLHKVNEYNAATDPAGASNRKKL